MCVCVCVCVFVNVCVCELQYKNRPTHTHTYIYAHVRTHTLSILPVFALYVDGSFCLEVPPRPECQAGTAGEGGKVEVEENSQYHCQGSQAFLGLHLESEYVLPCSLGCSIEEQFISGS